TWIPVCRSYALRAKRSSSRPRRAAGPAQASCIRRVFIDHSVLGVLNAVSPMITGASLAPIPCLRQRCHSAVFCRSRSILGMNCLLITAFGKFALQHFERTPVGGFGQFAQ